MITIDVRQGGILDIVVHILIFTSHRDWRRVQSVVHIFLIGQGSRFRHELFIWWNDFDRDICWTCSKE